MITRPILLAAVCAVCALFLGEAAAQSKNLESIPFGSSSDATVAQAPSDAQSAKQRTVPASPNRKREAAPAPAVPQQLGPPKVVAPGEEEPPPAATDDVLGETPLPERVPARAAPGAIEQSPADVANESLDAATRARTDTINVPTMPGQPIPNPAATPRKRAKESARKSKAVTQTQPESPAPLGPPDNNSVKQNLQPGTNTSPVSAEPSIATPADAPLTAPDVPGKKRNVTAPKNAAGNRRTPIVPEAPVVSAPTVKPLVDEPLNVSAAEQPLPSAAAAQLKKEKEELMQLRTTTINLLRALVDQGILSKEKAALLLGESERKAFEETMAQQAATEPPPEETTSRRKRAQTVRVPLVPETVKNEIREQVKQEVLAAAKSERWGDPGTLPEWLDRITWEGDLRLRFQTDRFDQNNASALQYNSLELNNLDNTQQSQNAFRMRVRLGMLAKLSDTVGVGIRIATGNLNNPVSTNTNLGNYANPYQLVLDRAYIKWDPNERWSISGGRMPNPWFWPTDLVWDEDLNFEGLAGSYKPQFSEALSGFITLGAFPLQMGAPNQRTTNPKDKWLYGVQLGSDWRLSAASRWRIGGALFEFKNVEAQRNLSLNDESANWSVPGFRQKGNSGADIRFNQTVPVPFSSVGLASKFRVVNIGTELEFAQLDPFFVKFSGDYARNIGFDRSEILARTGRDLEGKTNAYQARLLLGADAIRKLHDWQVFGGYRYIERDAVLDAFTDSDFWLGGTNTKGYFIGGFYGLDKNAFFRGRWLSGNQIDGPTLKIDVLQLDMNVRF